MPSELDVTVLLAAAAFLIWTIGIVTIVCVGVLALRRIAGVLEELTIVQGEMLADQQHIHGQLERMWRVDLEIKRAQLTANAKSTPNRRRR